tara:strand:+ start:90 stop:545 length:456 start_codon:yes stop_codon:yes gene_type:complete
MRIKTDYTIKLYLDIPDDDTYNSHDATNSITLVDAFDEAGFIDIWNYVGNDNTLELVASNIISEETTIEEFINKFFHSDNKIVQDWLNNIYKKCFDGWVSDPYEIDGARFLLEYGIIVVSVPKVFSESCKIPEWAIDYLASDGGLEGYSEE